MKLAIGVVSRSWTASSELLAMTMSQHIGRALVTRDELGVRIKTSNTGSPQETSASHSTIGRTGKARMTKPFTDDRPLPPRLIRVGDRRVLEPPERTAERNRRLNQRMEWPRWYLDPAAEPDPPHARTPLAEAMESGELERPARGRRTIAGATEGE